jgi:hypothetical protein
MRTGRGRTIWKAGALASGWVAASAWAWGQAPVPHNPTGVVSTVVPYPATGPVPGPVVPWPRTFREKLCDTFIGRPQDFVEPPVGFYIRENFGLMRAKADHHRFMLYRSDFLPGTNLLSPSGATRFNLMASRLPGWLGPVVIEWSPDEPGLAESRRAAVVATLLNAGLPIIPERVVIGPSIYPGTLGADAANYYNVMITRDAAAPAAYPPTPISSSGFGFGGTP